MVAIQYHFFVVFLFILLYVSVTSGHKKFLLWYLFHYTIGGVFFLLSAFTGLVCSKAGLILFQSEKISPTVRAVGEQILCFQLIFFTEFLTTSSGVKIMSF